MRIIFLGSKFISGHVIIDYIEIEIGGKVVDKQYGEWIRNMVKFFTNIGKKNWL